MTGRILCCSFVEIGTKRPYTFRADRHPWMTTAPSRWHKDPDAISDAKLCVAIRDELERYHCIIGWNSRMFDVPLLNARLLKANERPLHVQFHIDLMWFAGGCSNRIGSRKLVNVQKFLGLPEEKTAITWENWQRAAMGNEAAFDEVVHHCQQDVKVLAMAYPRLLPYISNIHR